jgi:hypothetical protein
VKAQGNENIWRRDETNFEAINNKELTFTTVWTKGNYDLMFLLLVLMLIKNYH